MSEWKRVEFIFSMVVSTFPYSCFLLVGVSTQHHLLKPPLIASINANVNVQIEPNQNLERTATYCIQFKLGWTRQDRRRQKKHQANSLDIDDKLNCWLKKYFWHLISLYSLKVLQSLSRQIYWLGWHVVHSRFASYNNL